MLGWLAGECQEWSLLLLRNSISRTILRFLTIVYILGVVAHVCGDKKWW
jgi:hypothetical protein